MNKNNFSWISCIISSTGIGFPITVLCMTLLGGYNQATRELLVWLVASVLFGLASGLFFRKANMGALIATVLHAACCLGIATTAGWLCGYADSFLALLGGMLPVFVLVYVVVYLSIFLAMKREEKRINKALEAE